LMTLSAMALVARRGPGQTRAPQGSSSPEQAPGQPDKYLLKDYRPQSLYRVPKTDIKKAKYAIVDVHCNGASATGADRFAEVRQIYSMVSGNPGRALHNPTRGSTSFEA
jgi:hypothetical protein